jgi:hypothetical protein
MENRDRDKVSRNNSSSTSGGDVNRETSSRIGNQNDDSSADFGQNIGRSENRENEPSRRSGSEESGMQGESGSLGSSSGSSTERGSSRNRSSEGEH